MIYPNIFSHQYTGINEQCLINHIKRYAWSILYSFYPFTCLKKKKKFRPVYLETCKFYSNMLIFIIFKNLKDLIMRKFSFTYLADPGEAMGCSTNSLVIHWLIQWVSQLFPPEAVLRRHVQTVRDSSSSYKTDYVIVI